MISRFFCDWTLQFVEVSDSERLGRCAWNQRWRGRWRTFRWSSLAGFDQKWSELKENHIDIADVDRFSDFRAVVRSETLREIFWAPGLQSFKGGVLQLPGIPDGRANYLGIVAATEACQSSFWCQGSMRSQRGWQDVSRANQFQSHAWGFVGTTVQPFYSISIPLS